MKPCAFCKTCYYKGSKITFHNNMPRKQMNLDNTCIQEARHKHDERHQTVKPTAERKFHLKVCRVCLATRVKMHNITEQGLSDMYKQVTGIEINNEDNLPKVLCWECVARLSNANNFIEKALRTRWILTNNQIDNGRSLTINSITSMNKTEYGLNSTLGYKLFSGNYANVHIIQDAIEADIDESGHLFKNKEIDVAEFSKSKSNFEAEIARETIDGKEILTSKDHNYIVTYKEDNANDDDGIKIETLDIKTELENEEFEVKVKEECLSHEEIVDESNKEMLQETINKELEFSDSATSEDYNERPKSIKERIKFEDNILETFTNSIENGSTNNTNTGDPGNTSIEVNNKYRYICDICNKTFVCKTRITRHLENHPEIFSCSFCAYETYQKGHFTRHINAKHTRCKEFHCSFCSYIAYDKNTLHEHINAQHTKNTEYICTFCTFKTYHKNNLKKHINAHHTKTTTFDCTFCDFTTFHKVHLLEHTNIKHTKSVSFICSFCSHKTYNKHTLSRHINAKHLKSTIFNCSFCNYKAYQKYHLNRHVKIKHK